MLHSHSQRAAHVVVSLMGGPGPLVHAYRLVHPPNPSAPDQLWEWQQPWIDHLLWHARTFGRRVEQRYFVTWDARDFENTRLWETISARRSGWRNTAISTTISAIVWMSISSTGTSLAGWTLP
jgi:hypothetical protein